MTVTRRVAVAVLLTMLRVGTVRAQATEPAPPEWRTWHPLVSFGFGTIGHEDLGDRTIEARSASVGAVSPGAFPLFRTRSTLTGGPSADVALVVPVRPTLAVELVGRISGRDLTAAVSGDAEGAPETRASERVLEYTAAARVQWLAPWSAWSGRVRPYVAVGGGHLRHLHEDRVLLETGRMAVVGLGAHLWLHGRQRGRWPAGISAELGHQWRDGGVGFDDDVRGALTAQVRLFAGW